ncbi:hypothetical protein Ciccas_008376 [Cichlidogyrus casuarinus]|uniref:Uncharacterized protein n=1 Tax=Cichlidogyrus casuarinus TaxID=1844966 RepID=A0ABD2Q4C6_9PLAT
MQTPNKTPRKSPKKCLLTPIPQSFSLKKSEFPWKHVIVSCIPKLFFFILLLLINKPQPAQETTTALTSDGKLVQLAKQLEYLDQMTNDELTALRKMISAMRLEFIKIVEQIPPSNPVQADLWELDLAIAKAVMMLINRGWWITRWDLLEPLWSQ